MEIGIDKLILTTREFSINRANLAGLTIKPAWYDLGEFSQPEPLLFIDNFGRSVYGDGALLNDKLYTFDINRNGCRVIINPSKPWHPFNLVSDTGTFANRITAVENQLKERGILVNMAGAKINRLDIARNIQTNEPVRQYGGVFSLLNMPRAKRQTHYPDGYATGNNSRGIIAYNKLEECRSQGHDVVGDNMLRVELQNKKTDAVKRFLGLNSYSDLLNCGIEEMATVYRKTIKNETFNIKTPLYEQPLIPFNDSMEIMIDLKERYPHSWEGKYRKIFGINELLKLHGTLENYLKLVKEIAGNRQQPKRVREDIQRQIVVRNALLKKCKSTSRYNEVLNKLVA